MVRRRLTLVAAALLASTWSGACESERDMPESVEMPESGALKPAMRDPTARDALMDTMPGGEMARGDSLAEMKLLREKMEER